MVLVAAWQKPQCAFVQQSVLHTARNLSCCHRTHCLSVYIQVSTQRKQACALEYTQLSDLTVSKTGSFSKELPLNMKLDTADTTNQTIWSSVRSQAVTDTHFIQLSFRSLTAFTTLTWICYDLIVIIKWCMLQQALVFRRQYNMFFTVLKSEVANHHHIF